MFFGVGFKVGATADVFLIEEDLWDGFNRLTDCFFQIGFGDAFRVDVHIAEIEVIAFCGQFLCQLFCAHTVGAPWTTVITANISLSKTSLTANDTYSAP